MKMPNSKAGLLVSVLLIAALALCLSGCGVDDIDISGYEDAEIELVGLEDEVVTVTIGQLKEMKYLTVTTESTSDKIGQVRATGVKLDTLLKPYGVKQSDFKSIKVYGSDDYDAPMYQDFLEDNEIIIAFGIDGEPLEEDSAPARIIIRESDSAYWTRMVDKIEFVK